MEPISDDELQRIRNQVSYAVNHVLTATELAVDLGWMRGLLSRLDAAESRTADADRMRQRIERLEDKLDAWHNLYGSEDWRSVLAAEMEASNE